MKQEATKRMGRNLNKYKGLLRGNQPAVREDHDDVHIDEGKSTTPKPEPNWMISFKRLQ